VRDPNEVILIRQKTGKGHVSQNITIFKNGPKAKRKVGIFVGGKPDWTYLTSKEARNMAAALVRFADEADLDQAESKAAKLAKAIFTCGCGYMAVSESTTASCHKCNGPLNIPFTPGTQL